MPLGTITALVMQTHDKERVNVFIDGAFALGINLATLQREALYKGKVLDGPAWSRLERAETDHQAWEAAVRLLEVRPRAEREVRDRLRRKGYDDEQIGGVVGRLQELGLLDDQQFAKLWVENRAATKPKGATALRQELIAKGVNREVAAQVVATATNPDLEAAQCLQVARKAVRRYSNAPDKPTFQRKLGAFLQRRGYRFETMKPILHLLWAELHPVAGEDDDEALYEPE